MTHDEMQAFEESNWLGVDAAVRDRCVWHLRDITPTEDQLEIAQCFLLGSFPPGFHHFAGTAIRNALRQVLQDGLLPPVTYPDGRSHCNWDDYYMAALRQAVLPREGEV